MNSAVPRLATPADLATVRAVTRAAYAEHEALLGGPPLPVTEDYRPRIEAGEVWLLDADGEAAAVLVLERRPGHLLVFSVAVLPDRRGAGLGVRLLRFARERTRDAGLRELRLFTNARMTRNLALYARFGFRETGRRPNPRRPGWTLVDMALDVPADR